MYIYRSIYLYLSLHPPLPPPPLPPSLHHPPPIDICMYACIDREISIEIKIAMPIDS